MNDDNLYLLFLYFIYGLTLVFLILKCKYKKQAFITNLLILIIYSGFFAYNLIYNNAGGTGLLWLIALMAAIIIHWLINLFTLILIIYKRRYFR